MPLHSHEQQLSTTKLSAAAESGEVARDLGFLPPRLLTPPSRARVSTASVLYVWPSAFVSTPRRA
jgi:hypothetical protein